MAGHSLGEYSALAAAGTFTLADAARLLRTRGRAMQSATPVGVGAMAALLGLDFAAAAAVAAEAAQGEVCQAANDNSDGQVVVSGTKAAVERALDIAKAKGAKRAILLPVSAPFHCALMQPAADVMAEALVKRRRWRRPSCRSSPMWWPDRSPIRRHPRQPRGPGHGHGALARMRGLSWLAQGVDRFCEIGAGKVLTGLLKKNAPDATGLRHRARRTTSPPQPPNQEGYAIMFDLTGKTALVTGATGGIGAAIATRASQGRRHRRHLGHARRGAGGAQGRTGGSAFT